MEHPQQTEARCLLYGQCNKGQNLILQPAPELSFLSAGEQWLLQSQGELARWYLIGISNKHRSK